MESPARGPVRLVRAAALAVVVIVLSAAAHVLGGGALPTGRTAAGSFAVVTAACWALAGVRLSAPLLLVVTGGSQLLAHHLLAAGPTSTSAVAGTSASAGMAGMHAAAGASGAGATDPAMLAGHATATVVLSLVLAAGEDALWRLWSWLAPLPAPAPRTPVVRPDTPAPRPAPAPAGPRRWVLLVAVPRRGPPVVLAG